MTDGQPALSWRRDHKSQRMLTLVGFLSSLRFKVKGCGLLELLHDHTSARKVDTVALPT